MSVGGSRKASVDSFELPRDTLRAIEDDRKDDILFAVIGDDNSGISNFIYLLTGNKNILCTPDVQSFRIQKHEKLGDRAILLVGPRLDGTANGERKALLKIDKCLSKMRMADDPAAGNLRGLLYLHDAYQARDRLGSSAMINHDIYQRLCGDASMKRVQLVLTNFGGAAGDISRDERKIFEDYWGGLKTMGSAIRSLDSTTDSQAIWRFVNELLVSAQEEDYDDLQNEHRNLLEILGAPTPSRKDRKEQKKMDEIRIKALELLRKTLRGLNNARHSPQDMKLERIRTQSIFDTIRFAVREKLQIRGVGERLMGFLARKFAQFVQQTLQKGLYGYRRLLLSLPVSPATLDFFPVERQSPRDGSAQPDASAADSTHGDDQAIIT